MPNCPVCQLSFDGRPLDHYRTDFHLFNIHRKLASLAPVDEETFLQKSKLALIDETGTNSENQSFYCEKCQKKFSQRSTYVDHLKSKPHKKHVEQNFPSLDVEEKDVIDSDNSESNEDDFDQFIGSEECLFCGRITACVRDALHHMMAQHGFTLSRESEISNIESLLACMAEIIDTDRRCIQCLKRFGDLPSVRRHMLKKRHFSPCFEGPLRDVYQKFYNFKLEENDQCQLELPNGGVVGHRSLKIYYDQRLSSHITKDHAVPVMQSALTQKRTTTAMNVASRINLRTVNYSAKANFVHRQQKNALKLGEKNNNRKHNRNADIIFG